MFVRRKKYEALKERCIKLENLYEKALSQKETKLNERLSTIEELATRNVYLSEELESVRHKLEKYKQLYADELQKRLELAELVQNEMERGKQNAVQ